MKKLLPLIAGAALVASAAFAAQPQQMASVPDSVVQKIRAWANDPQVVKAIAAQNAQHASLSQAEIDKMDKQWRAETKSGGGPLIDETLGNSLSAHLAGVKASNSGLFTEIFVMDNKGLNVGQSDVTSDYWQGDEAKWKNTFLAGAGAVFIDEVEFDESSQHYQVQTSVAIIDPASNQVIGAVTIGINVEML